MSARRFTCEVCRGTFEAAWTEADADAEAEKRCGVQQASTKVGPGDDDMAVVCEDCFAVMMAGQPN